MNSKKLCFVINQYGSLFYLLPIFSHLKKKKVNFKIYSDLLLQKKSFKEKISVVSLREISKYKVIITDAVKGNFTCQKITNLKKNYIIQFLDGWSYIKERFTNGKIFFLGNEIWSLDQFTSKKLKLFTKPNIKVFNIGHPGFENFFKKKMPKKTSKKKILIVLQNFKELNFKQTQYETIDFFENFFSLQKEKFNYYYLLHPGSEKKQYKNLKNLIRFQSDDQILNFSHIIGHYSTLTILSYFANQNTAVLYRDKDKKIKGVNDLLERFKIKKLQNKSDIFKFCNQKPKTFKKKFFNYEAKSKIYKRINTLVAGL